MWHRARTSLSAGHEFSGRGVAGVSGPDSSHPCHLPGPRKARQRWGSGGGGGQVSGQRFWAGRLRPSKVGGRPGLCVWPCGTGWLSPGCCWESTVIPEHALPQFSGRLCHPCFLSVLCVSLYLSVQSPVIFRLSICYLLICLSA